MRLIPAALGSGKPCCTGDLFISIVNCRLPSGYARLKLGVDLPAPVSTSSQTG
jgi:hypothetical protein